MKKRNQFFYEIGEGRLAQDAQKMYEDIQQIAMESKQAITMTVKIVVAAPEEGDKFGKTQYSITHTQPTKRSIAFTTEYEGGVAISDGLSVEGLLQTNLFPESERVHE